jgi:hypothetical protein
MTVLRINGVQHRPVLGSRTDRLTTDRAIVQDSHLNFLIGAVLIAAARVVMFWPVLVGIIGLIAAAHWTRRAVDRRAERVVAEGSRLAGLVARADQQHAWTMQGDSRDTFGEYPAAAIGFSPTHDSTLAQMEQFCPCLLTEF